MDMNMNYGFLRKEHFASKKLYKKGDIGLIFVPLNLRNYAIRLAFRSSNNKMLGIPGAMVPKFNEILYIDTTTSRRKLNSDIKYEVELNVLGLPENFSLILGDEFKEILGDKTFNDRYHRGYFYHEEMFWIIKYNKYIDCIFVNIDAIIPTPFEIDRCNFKCLLKLLNYFKSKNVTVVIISHFYIKNISNLLKKLDFIYDISGKDDSDIEINKYSIKVAEKICVL
jgi:hypothetical protein